MADRLDDFAKSQLVQDLLERIRKLEEEVQRLKNKMAM